MTAGEISVEVSDEIVEVAEKLRYLVSVLNDSLQNSTFKSAYDLLRIKTNVKMVRELIEDVMKTLNSLKI